MRKLFLLLPALVLSLFANAAVINITPTSPYGENDNLRKAVYYATAGDEIILADGTYFEPSSGGYLELNKNITIKAAEGAHPIIQMEAYARISNGANVSIEGLKFDGSVQGSYDYYFRFYDNSSTSLELDGCEFYDVKNIVITGKADSHTNSLIVKNCYFHNNAKQSIYFEASNTEGRETCDELNISNSTFANTTALTNWISIIDIRPYSSTNAIKVRVDHCTFYNNPCVDSGHANIRTHFLSDVSVSNCIFMHPTELAQRAVYCDGGGSVSNCLTYNFTKDQERAGIAYGCTVTNCAAADPLFNDLANDKYTFPNNWVTMSISPAVAAATDGSDLGDPRWYTAPVLPSTDFASPYQLTGDKAKLNGNIWYDDVNEYLYYNNKSTNGTAMWKIHAERACVVGVALNLHAGSPTVHKLKVEILDADGISVGELSEQASTLPGSISIPTEGDYTITLNDDQAWTSAQIDNITLSYIGGAVIPVSPSANTTLNIADALFSGCTRNADYIQFPSSETSSAWIKWNISTSETAFYDLTLNIDAPNAHGLTVEVFENEAEPAVASVTEGSYVSSTGVLALALGRINLVGGKNYIVKVTNAPNGSIAKITSLLFAPVVSSKINLPAELPFNQAVLSARAHVTDGNLYFAPIGDTDPLGEWAQWAVATDHDGLFLFTMNVNSDNGQSYRISIKDDAENPVDSYENNPHSGSQTITHYFALPAGNYFIKVENTTYYSHGYLVSFEVTESPNSLFISENATDNSAWASKVNDGNTYDVQIIRTLRAGMYNTFCLPFAVSYSQCKAVFGNDVEIYTLGDATAEGEALNVTLNNSSDIYQGTPVFIKPYTDIVNPIFTGVQFKCATPSATTKTNANFVGTFVSTTLTANTDILYLGPDNTLYYPEVDTPIKGFRAWFTIHGAAAPVIRRMNIIERTGEATSINLINDAKNDGKYLENGQLIIIRDGVRYNAMGIMIK
ncbi:MAG: DUF4957 domain-containing protein [Paludibacteraceae bacterium]|nr:DUF4957 domain-containing protein [Paludibacteraceae bacterium]